MGSSDHSVFLAKENVNVLFCLIHNNGTEGDDERSWLFQI